MQLALEFNLRKVPWHYFCTLTFRSVPSLPRAKSALFSYLRRVSKFERCHFSALNWAARFELGEAGKRLHLHVLLKFPKHPSSTADFMARVWQRQLGYGIAQVRWYDAGRAGVSYILKGTGTLAGGNAHETTKFRDDVILSYGLETLLGSA